MEDPIIGTVITDLSEEVDIPTDGTLSRVIHKDDSVRLVVFAFDKDQELTDHTAGVPAILQVISGTLEVSLDGERSVIGSKSWVHMEAGLTHAVRALEPSVMALTLIKTG